MTHCPCPIETADGVGVLDVVIAAEQSCCMLYFSKKIANARLFLKAAIL